MVVGVDVRRLGAGQLAEALELGGERAGGVAGLVDLGAVLDVVQPHRKPGCSRMSRAASAAAGRSTIRLVLVRMPLTWASMMPSLTPAASPKSSALTIRRRTQGNSRGREIELVGLADEVDAEAVVRVLSDQLETALEIEVPGRGERMVRP